MADAFFGIDLCRSDVGKLFALDVLDICFVSADT
jgi:hypothetical protein